VPDREWRSPGDVWRAYEAEMVVPLPFVEGAPRSREAARANLFPGLSADA
jgi:hypothetical protein